MRARGVATRGEHHRCLCPALRRSVFQKCAQGKMFGPLSFEDSYDNQSYSLSLGGYYPNLCGSVPLSTAKNGWMVFGFCPEL